MDLGAKFSQGEVIEGGHIGQDKRLRWGHLGQVRRLPGGGTYFGQVTRLR